MIEHPIKNVSVSALHERYKEFREFADTLIGQPYWHVCDLLVEYGWQIEFGVVEDDSQEFVVNYFKQESTDVRLGTLSLFVGISSEENSSKKS